MTQPARHRRSYRLVTAWATVAVTKIVVAIPVRNEADRIADCLRALALQEGPTEHAIVAFLNNCTDDTAAIIQGLRPSLPCPVHVVEHAFPPDECSAGHARRAAMDYAADLADPDGILMTTDADGRVAPDWIATNLAALEAGADAVCGRAIIDPLEATLIPQALHDDDALECAYGDLLDEIHAVLDPDPADPWPRHTEHSGASIAVRRGFFLRAGGVPAVRLGEDRALLTALRRVDARIRHAPEVTVVVSGRIEGRAVGGMADTMRRRMVVQDAFIDDKLEPARICAERARGRAASWRAWSGRANSSDVSDLAANLGLPASLIEECLAAPYFGEAWEALEAASPALARRQVARAELAEQTRIARQILVRAHPITTADAAD